jgi:hypothetical protein
MKFSIIISSILFLSTLSHLKAQTYVGGIIDTSEVWTLASSPYIVQTDIEVITGATLTIESGVIVKFALNTVLDIDGGKLDAQGTVNDSILFTTTFLNPTNTKWRGIFLRGWEESKMEYCKIEFASTGISTVISGATILKFKHTTFSDNGYGLVSSITNNGAIIDSCTFTNNGYGIYYKEAATITNSVLTLNGIGIWCRDKCLIKDCIIQNSNQYGICSYDEDSVINNIIINNSTGLLYSDGTVQGNRIENNFIGIEISMTLGIKIICNQICNNTSYNAIFINPYYAGSIANNYWCNLTTSQIATTINDDTYTPGMQTLNYLPVDNSNCHLSVSTSSIAELKTFTIYPNPASTYIKLETLLIDSEIVITDVTGKVIKTNTVVPNGNGIIIQLDDIPAGFYLVKQGGYSTKFIKT